MDTDQQLHASPHRPGKQVIRAGIVMVAAGFVVAALAAFVLYHEVQSLEAIASTAHAFSKIMLLIGLVLLLAGYRSPQPANRHRRGLEDQHRSVLADDRWTGISRGLSAVTTGEWQDEVLLRGIKIVGLLLLIAIFSFTLVSGPGVLWLILMVAIWISMVGVGGALIGMALGASDSRRAFAAGALVPWWLGTIALLYSSSWQFFWGGGFFMPVGQVAMVGRVLIALLIQLAVILFISAVGGVGSALAYRWVVKSQAAKSSASRFIEMNQGSLPTEPERVVE